MLPALSTCRNQERRKSKMADKNETHKEFSTCFEKLPFVEMMQKRMDLQGKGSLWAGVMEKVTKLHSCPNCPIPCRAGEIS